jgi:hypothetical protein
MTFGSPSEPLNTVTAVLNRLADDLVCSEVSRTETASASFTFSDVDPGTYKVSGSHDTENSVWEAEISVSDAVACEVVAGAIAGTGLNFPSRTGSISGKVTGPQNGVESPLLNATVTARSSAPVKWGQTGTDESGEYTIDGLGLGADYVVSFRMYDTSSGFAYAEQYWDNQPTEKTAAPLVATPASAPVLAETGSTTGAPARTEAKISSDTASALRPRALSPAERFRSR